MALSRMLGGLWTVTKVEGWAGAPLLPGFILLGVCDWRLWPVGGGGEGGGGELMGCVQSRELGGRASSSQVHPATKLQ